MKQKYFIALFILVMMFCSYGCGGSDSSSPATTDNQTQTDTETNTNNDTSTNTNTSALTFDPSSYTTGEVNGVSYRAYENIQYVTNPVEADYQKMSIYIPESYFSGGTINGYTSSTAPIFMPNGVGGYMKGNITSPSSGSSSGGPGGGGTPPDRTTASHIVKISNSSASALERGYVVAAPALRGRDLTNGQAPACIVDYKAAVRYLKYNIDNLPAGDTEKIISSGTSAGGAISALLGATGNSSDYDEWLNEAGAANASDDIFASMCYCPITNLDNADGAYEWVFGDDSDSTSSTLKANFISYVNSLGLKNGNDTIALNSDGTGTFRGYIEEIYRQSAQSALDDGESVNVDWVTVSGTSAVSADLSAYSSSFNQRQKTAPAFDKFDLSSAENNEFGDMHFTEYGYNNNTADNNAMADSALIKAMNPMNYIGTADTAKYWRIRHGTNDRDTSLAVPGLLALKLMNNDCTVDFAAPWGEGHGGDYDLDELFDWIDEICK